MKTSAFLAGLGLLLSLGMVAADQTQDGVPRIGFLSQCSRSFDKEQFTHGLRELGYVEGSSIHITWRHFPEGGPQLRSAADELVASKVDVLVTCSTAATHAAVAATRTIPIVFTGIADPIASGVVASLAKPGANATGVSVLVAELYPKRLDLLRQVSPRARRVAFIVNLSSPGSALAVQPLQAAAKTLEYPTGGSQHPYRDGGGVHAPYDQVGIHRRFADGWRYCCLLSRGADRAGGAQSACACGVPMASVSHLWCADVVWVRPKRDNAPWRLVRGQDLEGCETRRLARRASFQDGTDH